MTARHRVPRATGTPVRYGIMGDSRPFVGLLLRAVRPAVGRPFVDLRDLDGKTRTLSPDTVRRLCGRCTTRLDEGGARKVPKSCATCEALTVEVAP